MKKKNFFIIVFVLIVSCNSNKKTKPIVCLQKVEYHEPSKYNQNSPSLLIDIKVEDSVVLKKIESSKLTELILFSIKEEDRHFVYYQTWQLPIKTGNVFSFLIWTNYFGPSSLKLKHNRKVWSSNDIVKVLKGDIALVFEKDTVPVSVCKDREIKVQTISN